MMLLEARALSCHFGPKVAVQGLDIALAEGELVGLIGPNGAGKTTTFRMFAGLQRPTGGELHRHLGRGDGHRGIEPAWMLDPVFPCRHCVDLLVRRKRRA